MIGKFVAPAGAGTPSPKGIYIAGNFNTVYHGSDTYSFANLGLLNSDFTFDPSFKPFFNSGITTAPYIYSIIEQPDGKILVAGSPTVYQYETTIHRVLRLNADLTLDTSFVTAGGINNLPITMALQSDGKILLGGFFTVHGSTPYSRIVRLNSNGSLDTSFVIGTGFNNTVRDIKIQSDGKIIVGGSFTTYNGVTSNRLIRLNTDGSIDSAFNIGSGFEGTVLRMKIQSDGKVLVVGDFTSFGGVSGTPRTRCLRLNTDGIFDTTFNRTDSLTGSVLDVNTLSDGSVIIAGAAGSNPSITIAKYSSTGVRDTAFINSGMQTGTAGNFIVRTIEVLPDDKMILTGSFGAYNGLPTSNIVEINSNGTVSRTLPFSLTYEGFGSMDMEISKVLSTGKIMIGGSRKIISNPNNIQYFANILRLDSYNTINFSDTKSRETVDLFPTTGSFKLIVTKDGTRYLNSTTFSSQGSNLSKYKPNGSFDFSFNGPLSIMNGVVNDMTILPDDSIVFVGAFTSYRGFSASRIVKQNPDGTVSSSFVTNIGSGFGGSGSPRALELSSNGKIYAGGNFTTFNLSSRVSLLRLNQDGTLDTSFPNISNWGSTNSVGVNKIIELTNGKIIVIGAFTAVASTSRNGIARINDNGTLDTSFVVGTGFASLSSTVFPRSMTVQSSGKIVVVGEFLSYNGVNARRIIRLNDDGSVDSTFNSGTGFNNTPQDIISLPDGKMIVVGLFDAYNGNLVSYYCVLDVDGNFIETGIRLNSSASSIFIRD